MLQERRIISGKRQKKPSVEIKQSVRMSTGNEGPQANKETRRHCLEIQTVSQTENFSRGKVHIGSVGSGGCF